MQILFVIPSIGSVYGGPSKTVIDLAQALNRQGLMVDIVTTSANGSAALDVPYRQWVSESGYRIQYFPYLSVGDYKWSGSFSLWLFQHVCDYDVVHSNAVFSLPNVPAHWACQWHRIPYVMTPHGMLEPWALSYKAWKKRLYYNLLERQALNQASAIQALASPEAAHMNQLAIEAPIAVIPNGIHREDVSTFPSPDLFYQQFPETEGKTLILFLGRIDPKKGLDLLAPAFAKVQAQFSNAHLVVAGPDNIGFLSMVQAYFSETNCNHAVTFTGMISGELKLAALAAASFYVAPSYSEGFSMSILEGMVSKLACVITVGCNFPEAAAARAACVVPIDSDAIAHALIECLKDPAAAQAMGDRARQFIFENYTWDQVATKLVQVYSAITNNEPIPQIPYSIGVA